MDAHSNINSKVAETSDNEAAEGQVMPWLDALRARGWTGGLTTALDIVEPFGPLVAQVLWVVQPISGVFGGRAAIRDLAHALEDPEGIERLRQIGRAHV